MSGATSEAQVYDIAQILNALPHRYPLLLVDRVKSLKVDEEIHAVKAVSFNEQFFQGHFPGRPIMPGVLQIEALAQALCILIAESFPEAAAGKRPAFAGIEDVRFRRAVRPGDVLELSVELVQFRRGFATANAYASVNGEKAAEAVLKATMV